MHEEDKKKDLTGALRALEFNNAIITPEEKVKQDSFAEQQAAVANNSLIRPLRTFESDSADAIKQGQQSLYSISQAEKARNATKRLKETDPEKEEIKKNSMLLILSGVLFLAGGAFVLYFFLLKTFAPSTKSAPQVISAIQSIIPSQYETKIADPDPESTGSITKAIRATLEQNPRSPDEIENISITRNNKTVDVNDIILDLSPETPPSLIRAFSTNQYMVASVQKSKKMPFFIIKVSYYDNAFAGMLKWEADVPNIYSKLGTREQIVGDWRDAVVKNRDVRILKDEAGQTIMLYSFYDKNTLIIAPDEDVFSTILTGLRGGQISR